MEHTKVDKYTDIGNMEHSLTFQQTKEHFMKCILTRNVMKNIAKEQWFFLQIFDIFSFFKYYYLSNKTTAVISYFGIKHKPFQYARNITVKVFLFSFKHYLQEDPARNYYCSRVTHITSQFFYWGIET